MKDRRRDIGTKEGVEELNASEAKTEDGETINTKDERPSLGTGRQRNR